MSEEAAIQNKAHASIISPVVDFIMVGGVTLFVLPFVMLPVWESEENAVWLGFISYCLIFVLNLPHFIHSYQLLYRGYIGKLTGAVHGPASKIRMAVSGILAPVFLIGFLLYGIGTENIKMLGYATNLMLLTLGWHYVKQGYGIMIALSVRKKVFFDNAEKHVMLANAYITWLFSFFLINAKVESDVFYGIPFSTFGFSESLVMPLVFIYALWMFGVAAFLFIRFDRKETLCVNGLAAYFFSVYAWVLMVNVHPHFIIFVPALHSLQYLLCVWKLVYERTRDEACGTVANHAIWKKMVPFLIVGFGAGAVLFVFFPKWLDQVILYDSALFGPSLFAYCFIIFLNVHHYFIDFAIWRRDNPEMRYLFR